MPPDRATIQATMQYIIRLPYNIPYHEKRGQIFYEDLSFFEKNEWSSEDTQKYPNIFFFSYSLTI